MNLTLPQKPATCLDPSPPCAIDVVALSVGRPDGVYYAGKRLTPWMTFDERLRLNGLEYRDARRLAADEGRYQALKQRREGESVVIRWEIANGHPGMPVVLRDVREAEHERERRPYAYLWGAQNHVDVTKLPGYLLRDAMGEHRLYDEFYRAMDARVRELPDEWILSAVEIRHLVFTLMLARMERECDQACAMAALVGVDVGARVTALAARIAQIEVQDPSESQTP